jgi:hypothetical protein
MKTLLLALPALLALATIPAQASQQYSGACGYDVLSTGFWEITDGTPSHTYYLDDHDSLLGNGTWLYVESNGVWDGDSPGIHHDAHFWDDDNLQVGGSSWLVPGDDAICTSVGAWAPDQMIF